MICTKCKKDLDVDCFHKRGGGNLHKQCKFCKRQAIKLHYENNKQDYIDRAKVKNKETIQEISLFLDDVKNVPCKDCGNSYPPCAMDFDHLEGTIKVDNISDLKKHCSLKKIKEEILKCEIVCAVCHRIRTHKRNNNE